MRSIYGPPSWNARAAAETSYRELELQEVVARGKELWAKLGEQPHADTFWDVVAPLVHALAAEGATKAGYVGGFSAATACEQLMHEIAFGHQAGKADLSSEDMFGDDDLRRLNEIANRTFEELNKISTAAADLESLIQMLSDAADEVAFVTCEMLDSAENEAASEADEG